MRGGPRTPLRTSTVGGALGLGNRKHMQCSRPIRLEQMGISVPCGKCAACRVSKASEWSARLIHESEYHIDAIFATLTYSDENLPLNASLEPKDLELFWKRLRKRVDYPIKYFSCGEYGEETDRPHYHCIIFGLSPCNQCHSCTPSSTGSDEPRGDCKDIRESWALGLVHIGYLSYQSGRYVAGYLLKDSANNGHDKKTPFYNDYHKKPFLRMSKGLGKRWMEDNIHELIQTKEIRIDGATRSLPKYYVDLIKDIVPEFNPQSHRSAERQLEYYNELRDNHVIRDDEYPKSNINKELKRRREQIDKNIVAMHDINNRRGVKKL